MGLDTTHNCWHGAYSAFTRWREKLAEVAGLPPLMLMEGFWVNPAKPGQQWGLALTIKVSADTLDRLSRDFYPVRPGEDPSDRPGAHLLRAFDFGPIRWEALKPDPLHTLLYHSDCDGEIAAEDCGPIADSLERLLPLLPDGDGGGHIFNWRDKTQTFIDGLRRAAAANEAVEFH